MKIGVQISEMAQAFLTADWPNTAHSPYPAVTLAWLEAAQVGLARWLPGGSFAPGQHPADLDQYAFASLPRWRVTLGLVNTGIILILFWLIRRLYNTFVAVTATILMAFDPFLLTESRTFRTEGLTTGLMMLSALTVILYARERQTRWLIGSGILAGLATLTRISAFFMLPFAGFVLLVWPTMTGQRNIWAILKQTTRDVVFWSLAMGATVLVLWPALWASPLDAVGMLQGYLRPAVGEASRVWKKGVFFRGRTLEEVDPGLKFYLWALAYRTTPLMGLGVVAALAGSVISLFQRHKPTPAQPDPGASLSAAENPTAQAGSNHSHLLTWLILAYSFFYVVAINLTVIKIDRYLIAIFPALAILAAVGFQWLIDFFTGSVRRRRFAQVAVWGGALLVSIGFSIPHHPYYYTYWNPLFGGGQAAVKELPAMGRQGVDVLIDYLNGLPDAGKLNLAGTGLDLDFVQECPVVFVGTCSWYPDFLASDYFLMSIYSDQNDVYLANIKTVVPDVEVVREFRKDGVTYAWLYKMPEGLQDVGYWLDLTAGSFSGYRLSTAELGAGDLLEVTLFWQNGEKNGWRFDDSELFVTVLDESGQIQQTVPAHLKEAFTPYLSQPNEILVFSAPVEFPADAALGTYTLEMGLRLKATGEPTVQFPLEDTDNTVRVNRGVPAASARSIDIEYRLEEAIGDTGLTLLGYRLDRATSAAPEEARAVSRPPRLTLYWQADRAVSNDLNLELRLLDGLGQPAVTWRSAVAPEIHPVRNWQPGEIVTVAIPLVSSHRLQFDSFRAVLSVFPAGGRDSKPLASINLSPWPQDIVPMRPDPDALYRLEGVTFAGSLDLLGYDLRGRPGAEGGELAVNLYWLNRQLVEPVEVEIEALAENGAVIVRHLASVPPPATISGWQTVSRHLLRLEALPASLRIKARPVGTEKWYQVHSLGEAGTEAVIIEDILTKAVVDLD